MALHLINCYKKYLQNLKYIVKRGCIFHLIWVGILSILIDIVHKEWGRQVRWFCLMDKICETWQVICWQSLVMLSIKKKWNFENVGTIKNNAEFPHGSWSFVFSGISKKGKVTNHPEPTHFCLDFFWNSP